MGPRIFGIVASEADTVAIIRRGPSGWCQISRWDPLDGNLAAGSWLHGTIYPQRCDLSPDGRWLAYFALKSGARWSLGDTYLVVSRLPWLTALAAWSTCGTWTRGLHFVTDRRQQDAGPPDDGDISPLARSYGLAGTRPETFSVERRNGWHETDETPSRSPSDSWDEQRAGDVVMEKPRPGQAGTRLQVSGRHAAFRTSGPAWGKPVYGLVGSGLPGPLERVQWADWDRSGRLLVATTAGLLQVRVAPFTAGDAIWQADLADERPDPQPPPDEAHHW